MSKILIVEDNDMNLDMLSRRLMRRGFGVVVARDGEAGVRAAAKEKPDLILMDMSLPVMDGWESTRRLKGDPDTSWIPVIAFTAHALSGDREKCLEAGCDDYDTKPIQFDRLIAKIEKHLTLSAAARPPDEPTVVALGRPGSARILVVDDNEMNRDMLSRRLIKRGYDVALAEDGKEALALLGEREFDVVLCDIMMPVMNGYELLQHIKKDPHLRHLPVIMISAIDDLSSVVRCIVDGAEDYLTKPFEPTLLGARIEASLERKRWRDREQSYLQRIELEKKRADELLHVILPGPVVQELKQTNAVMPRRHDHVAVMFCDIVNFTAYCDHTDPQEVLRNLQPLVESFEELSIRHGLQKIKTIGDAYMATAGLVPGPDNPVLSCVRAALDMVEAARTLPRAWDVRVGIHVGPVVAGVIGKRQYLFDVWGDTVNTAARVESLGRNGQVNLSGDAWGQVQHVCYGECTGRVMAKGKGEIDIYTVTSCILEV